MGRLVLVSSTVQTSLAKAGKRLGAAIGVRSLGAGLRHLHESSQGWHLPGIEPCTSGRGSLLVNGVPLLSPSFCSRLISHLQLIPTLTSPATKAKDMGDLGNTKKLTPPPPPPCFLSFLFSFFPISWSTSVPFPLSELGNNGFNMEYSPICVLDDCT